MLDLIIKDAMIITPYSTYKADIAVKNGKVEAIGSMNLFGKAKRVIDAGSKAVLPGLVDSHTHMEEEFMGCTGVLDFYKGSVVAAFGGVTTYVDFSNVSLGNTLAERVNNTKECMAKSAIDYNLHPIITDASDQTLNQIKFCAESGSPDLKIFMTYRDEGIYVNDDELIKIMLEAKKWGAMPGVHAESNPIFEANCSRYVSQRKTDFKYFPEIKPPICEYDAVQKAINFAQFADVPLYIFHLSSEMGLSAVKRARKAGQRVYAETCGHYLTLTDENYLSENAQLYIMSPPLRKNSDIDALWNGIKSGDISTIGSDNSSYTREEKERFLERDKNGNLIPDFTKVVNGVAGAEERLLILMAEGVNKRRITLNKLCEIASYNPAKILGLYPRKGGIEVGSDADFVIIDLEKTQKITKDTLHQGLDHSLYDGMEVKGWPVMTILRGEVIVENGEFTGKKGSGEFVKAKLI
jgi:dihydropyrimidinase